MTDKLQWNAVSGADDKFTNSKKDFDWTDLKFSFILVFSFNQQMQQEKCDKGFWQIRNSQNCKANYFYEINWLLQVQ